MNTISDGRIYATIFRRAYALIRRIARIWIVTFFKDVAAFRGRSVFTTLIRNRPHGVDPNE